MLVAFPPFLSAPGQTCISWLSTESSSLGRDGLGVGADVQADLHFGQIPRLLFSRPQDANLQRTSVGADADSARAAPGTQAWACAQGLLLVTATASAEPSGRLPTQPLDLAGRRQRAAQACGYCLRSGGRQSGVFMLTWGGACPPGSWVCVVTTRGPGQMKLQP